ncbi:Hypothetical predicted protein [Podarcis lilfordi]|uniref:Uncharacterized protein n=1 Tax=Podarcis lilfordi TaxID=74358 RepID=A0AA35LJL9_9SAUR|nr:Hypothetical predicted protein [Podarcis lilfordi]
MSSSSVRKSESKTSLLRTGGGGSGRRAPSEPQPRSSGGRTEGSPEPSARRPLCHPGAGATVSSNGSLRRHQQQQNRLGEPDEAEAAPRRRGSGRARGSSRSASQEAESDGVATAGRGQDLGGKRASRESLQLPDGASPKGTSGGSGGGGSSKSSAASKPGAEVDPLFHQLHPILSSVFGQETPAELCWKGRRGREGAKTDAGAASLPPPCKAPTPNSPGVLPVHLSPGSQEEATAGSEVCVRESTGKVMQGNRRVRGLRAGEHR